MWFNNKKPQAKRKYKKREIPTKTYSKEDKLKLIKEFEEVGAPITLFCKWYGLGHKTFSDWCQRYKVEGEAGLEDHRVGKPPVVVEEGVKEQIIKLKKENPGIGLKKISDYLARNNFIKLCTDKVKEVLLGNPDTAKMLAEQPIMLRRGNSDKEPQRFERSKPGEMYQMDIMTFMLQGLYRIYIIACLDDFSRSVVSLGIYRSQTSERVLDVLKSAIEKYGMPKEVLTDNGRQFASWRGKSTFQKFLIRSGISHLRSRPYHPQTCGKVESLWRNMYQELLSKEPISSFEDAQVKINKWVEWYNFKRPHMGIDGMVPADRFFGVEKSMREVMEKGVGMVKEALIVDPRRIREPMYLVGKIGGKEIRVIAKEGSVMLEGLDGVEEKKIELKQEEMGAKNNGGNENTAGTEQILPGNTAGIETEMRDGGPGEEKESERDLSGDVDNEGDVPGMEEKSSGGHGESGADYGAEGPEAEGLRS
jgi:transposase InsO family protein/transposase-like protein